MPIDGIRIRGLRGLPEIRPGDDLCREILRALANGVTAGPEPGAIFVVAQKAVSKAEGRLVSLADVEPSERARLWAEESGRDSRVVEMILREARRIVRMDRGILIAETQHGFVCANAGVDTSNVPPGYVTLLPVDPDASARRLREGLETALSRPVAVIISDTFGRPWRIGLVNVALGVSGLSPLIDYRGNVDSFGRPLQVTILAIADELAAAAELVMGKTCGIPVAIIEGLGLTSTQGTGRDLIRSEGEDLFR